MPENDLRDIYGGWKFTRDNRPLSNQAMPENPLRLLEARKVTCRQCLALIPATSKECPACGAPQ